MNLSSSLYKILFLKEIVAKKSMYLILFLFIFLFFLDIALEIKKVDPHLSCNVKLTTILREKNAD